MKTLCLIFGLFLMLACSKKTTITDPTPKPVEQTGPSVPAGWKALTNLKDPSLCGVGVNIENTIYAGLGYTGTGNDYNTVSKNWAAYNTATNQWTEKAAFPGEARANAVAFSINGKAYVGLGTDYNRSNKLSLFTDFYEYDPAANTWKEKAKFPGIGRSQPAFFSIGTKAYVSTGNNPPDQPVNTRDLWEYDTKTDKWTKKENFMGSARCRAFAFAINGKGYVGGGEGNAMNMLNDFFEYDPATDQWRQQTDLPTVYARSISVAYGNLGYVFGGLNVQNTSANAVLKYDPNTNLWTKISDLPTQNAAKKGRFYGIAIPTGTQIYFGGGGFGNPDSPQILSDFYQFTPQNSTT